VHGNNLPRTITLKITKEHAPLYKQKVQFSRLAKHPKKGEQASITKATSSNQQATSSYNQTTSNRPDKQGREEQAIASNQQATSSNKPNSKQTREHNVSPRRTGQEIATNIGATPKQNRENQTPIKPLQDKCSIKNQGQ
jgi:hypothetical protein